MNFFPAALTFVSGLSAGIILAESAEQNPEVVNLNEQLADAPYYDRTARAGMGSRGTNIIGEMGWAWAITGLRHEKKIRAQIVLERGKIVHEYYRKDQSKTETTPGRDVSEHVHSVTKSFSAMIIAHMVEHPDYDIALEDTLGEIFDDDNVWNSVLSSPNSNDNQTIKEHNVDEMKKATLNNILAMAAGLVENRYNEYRPPIFPPQDYDNDLVKFIFGFNNHSFADQSEILPLLKAGKATWPVLENQINWRSGGESLVDALAIYDMEPALLPEDPTGYGKHNYIAFSPLLSYIINATSGLMPSQYLEKYFTPYLGPGPKTPSGEHTMTPWADKIWGWETNGDGMEYGWTGMNITARSLAKFGQLIIQGGSNGNGTQILPKHWTDKITTKAPPGTPYRDVPFVLYHHHFYSMFDPFYGYGDDNNWTPGVSCMVGWYGHLTCIQPKSQRVYVQLVEDDAECLYKNNDQANFAVDEKSGILNAMNFFYMMDKDAFGAPEPTTSPRVPNGSINDRSTVKGFCFVMILLTGLCLGLTV